MSHDRNPFDNDRYRNKVGSSFGNERYRDNNAGPIRGAGLLAIPVAIATIWLISQCVF